jgi:exodeoxyribonuclease X
MYYILDTETASLSGGVVELAYLKVDNDLNILDEFVTRVNPERYIEPGAQAIHGIRQEDVADSPTLAEVAATIEQPITLIAHNASFDKRMIAESVKVGRSLCTLKLSRLYVKGTTNHKLPTLKQELGLPEQVSHSALGDVHTVRNLLLHLLPLTGVDLETLVQRSNLPTIVHTMPFGKHKGLPVWQLPFGYKNWLLEQDIDADLRYTLEKFTKLHSDAT